MGCNYTSNNGITWKGCLIGLIIYISPIIIALIISQFYK